VIGNFVGLVKEGISMKLLEKAVKTTGTFNHEIPPP
jgi:hypothetical protein